MPNLVSLTHPSLQILGKTQTGVFPISDFRISSDDTDIKLGPLTKHDKRNKATSKKIDDNVMLANCHCDFPDLWPIWRKPEAGFGTDSL